MQQFVFGRGGPMYGFEWHAHKAQGNARKHGISFEEAASAFDDPSSLTILDPDHSHAEERFVLLGRTTSGMLVVVVHALRGENIRIISARQATPSERSTYEEA